MRFRVELIKTVVLISVLTASCRRGDDKSATDTLFTLLSPDNTNISFLNKIDYTEEFNTYTYRNFYNGAGVGIGDLNNDGLADIYFCSNQAGNKLYLNRGGFKFEDITEKAGVGCHGSWSTGVAIADIDGDGWNDIYVCKSGKPGGQGRSNELFINNGNLTFTEKAKDLGLENLGLSNHASFFDYDRDGDLDCYLLNNSFRSVTGFDMNPRQREIPDTLGGNKLFRNDNGHFVDVTTESGIYSSKIGFGLGVNVADVNRDGWPDIYVSNDFFERDYLYINDRDGTFTESLEDYMTEISQGAMGADIADLNNDVWPEIYATEMTAEDNARQKTKVLFDTWETYRKKETSGYFHQFTRNVLQLNNRNGSFSEIGRYSGVGDTDWSWGALIMDLDNDGWKDIFVANGIYKDLLDRDFLNIYSDPSIMRSMIKTEESAILRLIEMIPSVKIPNYAFHNNTDLTFTNISEKWGLNTPSFSNGAAYGDLDNDGDLDLVVNNVNMPSFVYRNESVEKKAGNYLVVTLRGKGKNTGAVGANATLYADGLIGYQELIPARGFQSSVDSRLHFGLGHLQTVDSLVVMWPNGKYSVLNDVKANQFLTIEEEKSNEKEEKQQPSVSHTVFKKLNEINGLSFKHSENDFNDFERDKLLFNMLSYEGPKMAVCDINQDGLEDVFICGAKDSPGALFVQNRNGGFVRKNQAAFEADRISEDTDCAFFDADNDGDSDLYATSGGNEFPSSSSALADRLYLNDGKGNFTKSSQILPVTAYISTSCVEPCDYDNDGDVDLFVGARLQPFAYGLPADGYLLENDGKGHFKDVSRDKAPALKGIGMITDMVWADIDNDGDKDMVIAGDWMPVKILVNNGGRFTDESERFGMKNTEGWWHTIEAEDLNDDGYVDFVLGNHGLNSFFKASNERPVMMYVNDFDLNGSVEQIICTYKGDKAYPLAGKDELVRQIPSLESKYPKFADYKDQTIEDIFPQQVIERSLLLNARIMQNSVLINTGQGSFKMVPLPAEAQFFPVWSVIIDDFNKDGKKDLLIGGNQSKAKPQTGIYEAGYGLFLSGDNDASSWKPVSPLASGFFTKGDIRDMKIVRTGNESVIIVARNNENLHFYKY